MPVNINIADDVFLDCYQEIRLSNADIKIYSGGRNGGKSHNIAQELTEDCLISTDFNCILVRKTFKSIRDSQYKLIKLIIRDWGLSSFFHFNETRLEITAWNGNTFTSRGCDDPENTKGIVNPSHCWYEEANQLEESDYTTFSTSLRVPNSFAEVQKTVVEYISFNPECDGDYHDFWIYKKWYANQTGYAFTYVSTITTENGEVNVKVMAVHTTYRDNVYCSPADAAKLEELKFTNPYYYDVYCNGLWGVKENTSPALVTFDRTKHLGNVERVAGLPLILSFDFNRNPMCCSVIQYKGNTVRFIETIKLPNSTIDQMCDQILVRYPNAVYIAIGDYTGNTRSGLVNNSDYDSYWKVIKKRLKLSSGQVQVIPNPKVVDNLNLINYCYYHLDIKMDTVKCQALIFDCQNAKRLADGSLQKAKRDDEAQQLDAFDTMRYFFNWAYGHLAKQLGLK